ncbi:MAG: alpha/beta hydrolase family protein [Pyrinomonadaceae bacterium]
MKNEIEIHHLGLSSRMNRRKLPYAVLAPKSASLIEKSNVLYLLHGLFGSYENWLNNTDLCFYLEKFNFLVVCITGENSWYVDSENGCDFFESYFVEELIPEVENRFVGAENKIKRSIAGISMGGYGAFKFAFKYPQKFVFAAAMSGAFHASRITDGYSENDYEVVYPSILEAFGEPNSETRKKNDLCKLITDFPVEQISELPFLYFDCGSEDSFLPVNLSVAELFAHKRISHEYRQLPGGHDWFYWNSRIENILIQAEKLFEHPSFQGV